MTDEAIPNRPAPSVNMVALGMICAVLSALMLLYSAEYVFYQLPAFLDVWKSVKVKVDWPVQLLIDYGAIMWVAVAVCTVLSFVEASRHGGQRRAVRINVAVFAAALILALMVRHALWRPFFGILQGIPE